MATALQWSIVYDDYPFVPGGSATDTFINGLANVSPGNLRALWLPLSSDTTKTTTEGRVWTYNATIASRKTTQGHGVLVDFTQASAQNASTPDTDDLSFGDGTEDSPFSLVCLATVTDGTAQTLISKYKSNAPTAREWELSMASTNMLFSLWLADESVPAQPGRVTASQSARSGVPTLWGSTYSAATGGATAANDITLYINGTAVSSTPTNVATYVAMEPTTTPVFLASRANPSVYLNGDAGFAAIYGADLSAAQHDTIRYLTNQYFGLAL